MDLLIATSNPGKVSELRELLAGLPLRLVSLADVGLRGDVPETGSTFRENALIKVEAYAAQSGLLTLADDSGLEVDALGGAPGIHSARYSPKPNASDADRRAHLLDNLQGKPRPWMARFVCVTALTQPGHLLHTTEGSVAGEIVPQERGQNGFGYDPLFFVPEYGRTMAELPSEIKNRISHRGRAMLAMVPFLQQLLLAE